MTDLSVCLALRRCCCLSPPSGYYYAELGSADDPNTHWNRSTRKYEKEIPEDCILVHLKASPEVIRARMESDPHEFQVVPCVYVYTPR